MTQRPDRSQQNIFDFSNPTVQLRIIDPSHILITVPQDSKWRAPLHWHVDHPTACRKVQPLKENTFFTSIFPPGIGSVSGSCPPSDDIEYKPGDHHTFGTSYVHKDEFVAMLEVESSQSKLLRQTCAATLDADSYPYLASTPYWMRLLYRLLGFAPRVQNDMLRKLLWIQIQMMRRAHDYYVRCGCIDATYLWKLTHWWDWDNRPPDWVYEVEWWSYGFFAKVVQGSCYWVGRLMLGMKAEYPEYMPRQQEVRDNQVSNEGELAQI